MPRALKILLPLLILILPALAWATTFQYSTEFDGHRAAADSCLVEFTSSAEIPTVAQRLGTAGYALRQISLIDGRVFTAAGFAALAGVRGISVAVGVSNLDPSRDLAEQMDEIRAVRGVAAVWPNYIHHLDFTPNDPYYSQYQGNFRQIYVDKAWNLSTGSGATVAVIDTGYRRSGLEDRVEHLLTGYDFWGNDTNPNDYIGHGTHISNTVAEHTDNGIGCAGIAFDANVLPCKVFPDWDEGALESDIIDAINWATSHDADVINMSLGGGDYVGATASAISYAVSNEVVVFAAAGNDGTSGVEYPAAYEDCIAVGATKRHSVGSQPSRASFSNFGSGLDLVAPGVEITQETWDPNYGVDYFSYDGTSSATPHASATAALLVAHGGPDASAIRSAMQTTARGSNHQWNSNLGWGEIDAFSALEEYGGAANEAPKAVADAHPTSGAAPLKVAFDGSGSSDSDGSIVSYVWTVKESGKVIGQKENFSYTFLESGTYTVQLVVKDNQGASDSDSVTIKVGGGQNDDDAGDDDQGDDTDLGDNRCADLLETLYYGCEFAIRGGGGDYSAEEAYAMCQANDPSADAWECLFGCQGNSQVEGCDDYRACAKQLCDVTLDSTAGDDDDSSSTSVGYGCSLG